MWAVQFLPHVDLDFKIEKCYKQFHPGAVDRNLVLVGGEGGS